MGRLVAHMWPMVKRQMDYSGQWIGALGHCRDQSRMWVHRPMFADLPTKSERLPVRGRQKVDRGRVDADAVIERVDLMLLVDAAKDHHPEENLKIVDFPGIARKKRFDFKGTIRFDDHIHPRR
jgi:hypothetical protein